VSRHRALLVVCYAAVLGAFVYYLLDGLPYYRTPLRERPRHEDYWTLKPGGTLGRAFGVAGILMMTAMHAYSARKRARLLRGLGPLRRWLDFHILMGVGGPLFVVLHSSFKVQGLVSVSFWSMVAVALSGVFGRYLYLQIPRTRAGEALTLAEAEREDRELSALLRQDFGLDDDSLRRLEALATRPLERRSLARLLLALLASDLGLRRNAELQAFLRESRVPPALARRFSRLVRQKTLLRRRLVLWDRVHQLFHYWHVVHKPFAIVMYVFVLLHIGVASLTGYAWPGGE
jgi:hypothetical protein